MPIIGLAGPILAGATEAVRVSTHQFPVSDSHQRESSAFASSDFKGVHGWLKFYCISMCVLGPLSTLAHLSSGSSSTFGVVLSSAFMVFQIAVGISIFRVSKNALKYLRLFLIIQLVFSCLEATAGRGYQSTPDGNALQAEAFKLFFAAFVWGAYFKKSVRVRNTFGRNL